MKLLSQFSDSMQINEINVSYHKKAFFNDAQVNSSKKASDVLRLIYDADTIEFCESFYVLFLDTGCSVIGYYMLARGGSNYVPVDVKIIYALALKTVCNSIIISHNHPSGTLQPSSADINLTKQVVEAGKLLNIAVVDHIIITKDSYVSLADEGLL